jgi:hypothetical protein
MVRTWLNFFLSSKVCSSCAGFGGNINAFGGGNLSDGYVLRLAYTYLSPYSHYSFWMLRAYSLSFGIYECIKKT